MEVAIILNLKTETKLSEKYNNPQTVLFRRITTHQCGLGDVFPRRIREALGRARTQDLSDLRQAHYPVQQGFT